MPAWAGITRSAEASPSAAGASAIRSTGARPNTWLVPHAMANLAPVPDGLSDEQVLMCPDIMSTGFGGAERGGITIGDSVAVFAQGPIDLRASAGAKLKGATRIIAVDGLPERLERARRLGADATIDFRKTDPIAEIMRLTDGRGRGCRHRGARHAAHLRELSACAESGWRALEPGCLCRPAVAPARGDR